MNNKIFKTYIQVAVYITFILIIFTLCRAGFIINSGILNSAIIATEGTNPLPITDIIKTILAGFRYDGRLAATFTFIFLALYILFSFIKHAKNKVIITYTSIISYIIIIASFVNDTYYGIFNDTL